LFVYCLLILVLMSRIPKELAQATLLYVLVSQDRADDRIVSLLLSSGANPREPNMETNALPASLILMWSEREPKRAFALWKLLFSHGADAEQRTAYCPQTILEQAISTSMC
jgi:hypothetical protein